MAIAKAVMRRISVTGVYQGLPVEKARFTVTDASEGYGLENMK
ncbi:MAG: hypothetical protein ACLP5V_12735 [Candidatus Bathyarchaeia archaeon]